MGDVVKLDRKAIEERRKAAAKAAEKAAAPSTSGRPIWAILGGLMLVLMIVVTLML
jgi:hypothetical protein